jgi:NADH-quinone oxidoreductase subunit L
MTPLFRDQFYYLGLIVLMPLLGSILNGVFGSKLPKKLVDFIACGAILMSFFFSLLSIHALVANAQVVGEKTVYGALTYTAYQWIYSGSFGVDLAFLLDPLTSLMLLLITGVGFLIHLYSTSYMAEDESKWRYFSYLNLFCFSMLLLVLGKNMLVTFIGWEGVGVCSYLLIGFWYTDDEKAAAGQKAFIVNRVGDFAFLLGMFILFYETGTVDYGQLKIILTTSSQLATVAPVAGIASILIFVGCTGKSAQIPLYTWLPDAMAGPTPVSALIHAATMVTAGVFLLSRMNFLLTISWEAMMVVAWIGALTAFFAASIAIVQNDIKKVLAYSTVSQLGYMFLAVGSGSFTGAVFHLMTHAFFKALMFLGSGSVIHTMQHAYHATHSDADPQDIRNMGGLKHYMPWTARTFLIGCLAISGVPLFSGFFSKDLILWSALSNAHVFTAEPVVNAGISLSYLTNQIAPALMGEAMEHGFKLTNIALFTRWGTFLLGLITAGMTAFYMFRLYILTFEGENRTGEKERKHLHESPEAIVIPLAILAGLALVGGYTGWPHFIVHGLHLPEGFLFFEHWFSEVFEVSMTYRIHGRFGAHPYLYEGIATFASVAVGATGIGLAYLMYVKRPELPGEIKAKAEKLHELLTNKYYVDEGYDAIFVQGTVKTGEGMTFFDQAILDQGVVDGAGQVMTTAGRVLRHMQSGNMQRYATYITLAVVLALMALLTR